MTPEERIMLRELHAWMLQKKEQQITLPLDDASKSVLGAPLFAGAGNTTLTQTLSSTPGSIGKIPVRSVLLLIDGSTYEFPSLI